MISKNFNGIRLRNHYNSSSINFHVWSIRSSRHIIRNKDISNEIPCILRGGSLKDDPVCT